MHSDPKFRGSKCFHRDPQVKTCTLKKVYIFRGLLKHFQKIQGNLPIICRVHCNVLSKNTILIK